MSDTFGGEYAPTGRVIAMPDGTTLPVVVGPGGEAGVILHGDFVRLQDLPFQAVPFDTTSPPEPEFGPVPGGPIGPIGPPPQPPPGPPVPQGPVVRNYDPSLWWIVMLLLILGVVLIPFIYIVRGNGKKKPARSPVPARTVPSSTRAVSAVPAQTPIGLNIRVSGTVAGQRVKSRVYGPATLACTTLPQPKVPLVQVTWSGRLSDGRQISGEFVGPLGQSLTFGTNDPNEIGNANISVGNSGRVGGGVDGGTGSLTMSSATSGTIDATLETGAQVDVVGAWKCSP